MPPEMPEIPDLTTESTEAAETTESTEAVTGAAEAEDGQEKAETGDTLQGAVQQTLGQEECCGWCPWLCIGMSILSLLLVILVILQAVRMRDLKKKLKNRPRNPRSQAPQGAAPAAVAAVPVAAAAPGGIRVGKLHCLGDRESQQDCLAVSPTELYGTKGVLAVVADGMGGLSDGDRMSQTAAGAMMSYFMNCQDMGEDTILALTAEANQAVNRVLGPQNQGRSGTTLVAGIVKDGLFHYVSVGDSRICLYRQGALIQLNREHVYRYELAVNATNGYGTLWDAHSHPKAAGLTSYLGMGNLKYVDIPAAPLKIRQGDKLILMSDGVYNALQIPELEEALQLSAQQAADRMGQLIHAKAYRHQDNYTAVILEF